MKTPHVLPLDLDNDVDNDLSNDLDNDFSGGLDRAAATVADRGIDAIDASLVDAVAARALLHGASQTLVDIAVDPAAPTVARVRAFGRLAVCAARTASDRFVLAA